jgi:hypothetical protein
MIIKKIRKPYLPIFLACLTLFVSCNQYENIEKQGQNFDYTSYYKFIENDLDAFELRIQNKLIASNDHMGTIVNEINSYLDTEMYLPEVIHKIINEDAETIFKQAVIFGWLTMDEVMLAQELISDIQHGGFDKAIENYEIAVLNSQLDSEAFEKQNQIVNILRSQNHVNPGLYNYDFSEIDVLSRKSCDWCKCAAALVALTVATANLGSCVTVVACGLALVLVYAASNGVAAAC